LLIVINIFGYETKSQYLSFSLFSKQINELAIILLDILLPI